MTFRSRWNAGETVQGCWLSFASPVVAEAAARSGFGYCCVDLQHGSADLAAAATMLQAIELGGSIPIARAEWNDRGHIGRLLDLGAHGVVVPMINTAAEAEALVASVRYSPVGVRSWGPLMPRLRHEDVRGWADDNVVVIPMIETAQALENLDEILAVAGIDAVYVGPADLSLSLGLPPGNNDGDDRFDAALAEIVAACNRHSVVAGIHATGRLAPIRRHQGFRMITVASDLLAMKSGFAREQAAADGEHIADDDSASDDGAIY